MQVVVERFINLDYMSFRTRYEEKSFMRELGAEDFFAHTIRALPAQEIVLANVRDNNEGYK
nr:hypothetical protein [Mucilaginibacter sp. X5P1]